MAKKKTGLTVKVIEAMAPGTYIADDPAKGGERGLFVEKRPTGGINFFWRRRVNDVMRRFMIGEFPAWSIPAARDEAREWNRKLALGEIMPKGHVEDPAKRDITFAELWEIYTERHMPRLAEATQRDYKRCFEKELTDLHDIPISEITKADIASAHVRIGSKSQGLADKARILVSSMLKNAMIWCDCIDKMPVLPKPFGQKKIERFLDEDEVSRLLTALDNYPEQDWADYFRVVLFTGARRMEVQSMRWEDILLDRGLWKPVVKGGRKETIGLVSPLVALLKKRKEKQKHLPDRCAPYVFPSLKSESGHIINPCKHWKDIRAMAKITQRTRIHDLRHTLGTWLASDSSPLMAQFQLGHKQASTTERYVHSMFNGVLAATESAVGKMLDQQKKK